MSSTGKRSFRSPMENPIDPLPGGKAGYEAYQSFQKIINSNNGQIDEDKLQDHIDMILDNNWEEIPVSFELLSKGNQIRYTTLTPKGEYLFRTGGWVTAFDEEDDPPNWLAYHAHTHTNWCLQLEDCQRLFVYRKPEIEKEPKLPNKIQFKLPGPESNFNVYLPDENGDLQRIFSGRDNYAKKRFESSKKFEKAQLVGWEFKEE